MRAAASSPTTAAPYASRCPARRGAQDHAAVRSSAGSVPASVGPSGATAIAVVSTARPAGTSGRSVKADQAAAITATATADPARAAGSRRDRTYSGSQRVTARPGR